MIILNESMEEITEYDLVKGSLCPATIIRPDATPIDNRTKFAWADDDYETVQIYRLYDWAKPDADIEEFRNRKIQEMSDTCASEITNGFYIGEHKFSLEYSDQIAMMKILMNIQMGATEVQWHPDNEDCTTYTAEEFSKIAASADAHITWHQTYFNSLKKYLKSVDNVDELTAATYGMEIPVEYQTAALKTLIAARDSK